MRRTTFARLTRGAPILLAALAACTAEPNGPPCAWITVSDLPADSARLGSPLWAFLEGAELSPVVAPPDGPGKPALWIASAFTGQPVLAPVGAPGAVILPGGIYTLPKAEANAGLETASFVTDHAFDEDYGFQQGFFHSNDMGWIEATAESGWIETAVEGARAFIAEKLPRPMEDAPFVWLHLDLSLVPDPAARAAVVADALARVGAELAAHPGSVTALWALPREPQDASFFACRGPHNPAGGGASLAPEAVGEALLHALGHRLEFGVVRIEPKPDQ